MIYGLYLSATGVQANIYRQDVIANNIANSETVGFKRDLALLRQRPTEAKQRGLMGDMSNSNLENVGGGLYAMPTTIDNTPGDPQPTGNDLDVAIQGKGYFAVTSNGKMHLTRNGQFLVDRSGKLSLANDVGQNVVDEKQSPIVLNPGLPVTIAPDGTITQAGKLVGKLGLFDVDDPKKLQKEGGTLLAMSNDATLSTATPTLRSDFVERSNVDSATELTQLMDAQRQLEANANMIHTQDETLDKLVNDVGKVG